MSGGALFAPPRGSKEIFNIWSCEREVIEERLTEDQLLGLNFVAQGEIFRGRKLHYYLHQRPFGLELA